MVSLLAPSCPAAPEASSSSDKKTEDKPSSSTNQLSNLMQNSNAQMLLLGMAIAAAAFVLFNRKPKQAYPPVPPPAQGPRPAARAAAPPAASGDEAMQTAKLLHAAGATLYGSKNCGHTVRQQEMFGPALKQIKYVECSQGGCKDIRGFPSWRIGNHELLGRQPFDKLRETAQRVLKGDVGEPKPARQPAAAPSPPQQQPAAPEPVSAFGGSYAPPL